MVLMPEYNLVYRAFLKTAHQVMDTTVGVGLVQF